MLCMAPPVTRGSDGWQTCDKIAYRDYIDRRGILKMLL